ncbi:MAG: Lrp/AsnC family transcriptional regulator [Roseitalea sp.]|uniref:Lrp/AsnC family transcriptional regulator n=1 Tax=Oceaniradius stylonematis TaxID=2184161 RepID=A0A3A8ALV9_9HYPH|nr:Lrp/AsnC family transcriptional regulator [Oceaniradius stylonematis]MBO6554231.1 Lrp/AsnC family transcriptional regulator [Roseitalea sp.]MBO6953275.1 Lrp/AsnC family transcriptional regulator [Rhizobiaceae bacterium]RNC91234.1 MAG: Lrp/AsnC family transcriptional regulator [Oricola sp.]MBO6593622.1 Lrp/AsnC family transcriptional regulator [Roseitalea sp.]MBO6601018.1 Lrp/AsnC family transcriptional regulator [Roseitalea sp.]
MSKPIDEIDRRILRALVANGRLTNAELAKAVGLSASPCWQRVKRLEEKGVIAGYTAVLNHEALGVGETVMVEVSLDQHETGVLEAFGKAMADFPEVLEVHLMAGDHDFHVKIVADGTRGVEEFLRERLFKIAGLRHSKSSFSLRCLKRVSSFVPV